MTTLTKAEAAVTLTGAAERIVLPSKYSWVWVRNDTSATVYISQTEDIGEGVADTVAILAGGAARLTLTGDSFYALGTGSIQISAQNYADCPFKAAPGNGGGVTLTRFATLTRATTSDAATQSMTVDLPAGTVLYARIYNGGYHSSDKGYRKYCDICMPIPEVADKKDITATEPYNTSFYFTLRYIPSTQTLSVIVSNASYAYVAEIYKIAGVVHRTEFWSSSTAKS